MFHLCFGLVSIYGKIAPFVKIIAHIKAGTNKKDKQSQWIQEKLERSGMNKTAVAVASRNARIAWALLSKRESYSVT